MENGPLDGKTLFNMIKKVIGKQDDGKTDRHPYDWLRDVTPEAQAANYFDELSRAMGTAKGNKWDEPLPDEVFSEETDLYVTLAMVNYREKTVLDDSREMATAWRTHSAVRVLSVVETSLIDKKGANTSSEKPFLVAQESMKGVEMKDLMSFDYF